MNDSSYHADIMTMDMNDESVTSLAQLREFVKLSKCAEFKRTAGKAKTYEWIGRTLGKFRYFSETKNNRNIIKEYVKSVSGYSDSQIDRLIKRKKDTGMVFVKERTQNSFQTFYEVADIKLLAEVTSVLENPNGYALKKCLEDMYQIYGDDKFEKLSHISKSHIYNLRKTKVYTSRVLVYTKTKKTAIAIGERRKPDNQGKPGFLRVDSVHQGDLDKEKGVYYINIVDEISQWEFVGCVETISEQHLIPVLEELLELLPFKIINFHSDNGSEYINKVVANLLNKLSVSQTKSRARHSNDNALVEGKNGAVIRKNMGYGYIPKRHALLINEFLVNYLNPHLNFHRHCAFAEDHIDEKGKIKKEYKEYLTPCQKLLSIKNLGEYLVPGVIRESLETESKKLTHFESAKRLQEERLKLFKQISAKI